MIKLRGYRLVFALALASAAVPTWPGAPLSTEDPGILAQGEWEVIGAVTASSAGSFDGYQVPLLDVALGVIADKVQIAVAYPYVITDPDDGGSESGFGNDILDIRTGFDFAWREDVHLLFSAATGLREPHGEPKLDYDLYFGVQFFG